MNWLFSPPSLDDLIRLLKAWRFWVLGALTGALLGALFFYVAPPPYRARATVNVDFNLEEAWPEESDRQQFYYLERETRKLEEIAWSDAVMMSVAESSGMNISELRGGVLSLSQPAEGGWHFYADDRDAAQRQSVGIRLGANLHRAGAGRDGKAGWLECSCPCGCSAGGRLAGLSQCFAERIYVVRLDWVSGIERLAGFVRQAE